MPPKTLGELRERGLLSELPALTSLTLGNFTVVEENLVVGLGGFSGLTHDKAWGDVSAGVLEHAPSLVFLTRQPAEGTERVFKIALPNYYDGILRATWQADLSSVVPIREEEIVRAYAFDLEGLTLTPFAKSFVRRGEEFAVVGSELR